MLANNPELWQKVYGGGDDVTPDGLHIHFPTTEEEFEVMLQEWQGVPFPD